MDCSQVQASKATKIRPVPDTPRNTPWRARLVRARLRAASSAITPTTRISTATTATTRTTPKATFESAALVTAGEGRFAHRGYRQSGSRIESRRRGGRSEPTSGRARRQGHRAIGPRPGSRAPSTPGRYAAVRCTGATSAGASGGEWASELMPQRGQTKNSPASLGCSLTSTATGAPADHRHTEARKQGRRSADDRDPTPCGHFAIIYNAFRRHLGEIAYMFEKTQFSGASTFNAFVSATRCFRPVYYRSILH